MEVIIYLKKNMKAIRIILSTIKHTDKIYNFFNEGDKIAIGISGGKDSMLLLYSLHLYQKFSKIKFEIIPVTIDLGFDGFEPSGIIKFSAELGYNLKIVDGKSVYKILKTQKDLQKLSHLPCSICSRMKKAIINSSAHELGCNKVAFAHHKNDAIETLLLNQIYGARIATFSPKMYLSNEKITFIRPLIHCSEKDIKRAVSELNIPFFPSHCPNDGYTKRADIKELVSSINKTYKESQNNFLTMLSNEEKLDLFYMHETIKVEGTKKNLWYKKINNIDSFIEEKKFLSTNGGTRKLYKDEKGLVRYHLYCDNKLIAIINIKIIDKEYHIKTYKYLNYQDFSLFIFDLYLSIYERHNPLAFYITSKRKDFLKEIGFSKVFGSNYMLNINPISIIMKRKRGAIF